MKGNWFRSERGAWHNSINIKYFYIKMIIPEDYNSKDKFAIRCTLLSDPGVEFQLDGGYETAKEAQYELDRIFIPRQMEMEKEKRISPHA